MKLYPVGIVGEANYQTAIMQCHEGERVFICHEQDNPYDTLALRVERRNREVIGYIPRSHWLRKAIHDEGRGCTATIKSINLGDEGKTGIVLDVGLCDDEIMIRHYAAPTIPAPTKTDGIAGLIRGIFAGLK